jgi:predicted acylesterase/phospholipase RssA
MTIKYLVLSGGGSTGLVTYGVLKNLHNKSMWDLKNLKAVYGTSIGAVVGVMIILDYEWDFLDKYIIERPWNKLIDIEPENFINLNLKKGLLDTKIISEILLPLLEAKGFSKNITLKEFFEKTNIEFHAITCNLNSIDIQAVENISYKTRPNMLLLKAIEASSCIPFLFSPVCEETNCYIDGGLFVNYPLNICLEETKCELDEVLGIKNKWEPHNKIIDNNMGIAEFICLFIKKVHAYTEQTRNQTDIPNCVVCWINSSCVDIGEYSSFIYDKNVRKKLIKKGEKYAEDFLKGATAPF